MEQGLPSRRDFLQTAGILWTAGAATALVAIGAASEQPETTTSRQAPATGPTGPFKLPELGYAYDALEPYIDAETMHLHHDKHHAAYAAKLNAAVAKHPELGQKSIVELITNLDEVPADIRTDIANQGGGFLNHSFFWPQMKPGGSKQPTGELAEAINKAFGSFDNFKKVFQERGEKQFGSGWVWLIRNKDGALEVVSTLNMENPLSKGAKPLLANDLWEHAYYLKYHNLRGDYLKQWWNVVNWDVIADRFKNAGA